MSIESHEKKKARNKGLNEAVLFKFEDFLSKKVVFELNKLKGGKEKNSEDKI